MAGRWWGPSGAHQLRAVPTPTPSWRPVSLQLCAQALPLQFTFPFLLDTKEEPCVGRSPKLSNEVLPEELIDLSGIYRTEMVGVGGGGILEASWFICRTLRDEGLV